MRDEVFRLECEHVFWSRILIIDSKQLSIIQSFLSVTYNWKTAYESIAITRQD